MKIDNYECTIVTVVECREITPPVASCKGEIICNSYVLILLTLYEEIMQ